MEIQVVEEIRGDELLEQILGTYGGEESLRHAAFELKDNDAQEMWATVQLLRDNPKRLRATWKTVEILQLDPGEIEQLTEKRLALLDELQRFSLPPNVRGLAREVGRDKKNVSRDLKALASIGLVRFKRRGREAIPMLAGNVIRIDFRRRSGRPHRRSAAHKGRKKVHA